MRVFVTGATGFIGTAIVQELVNARHHLQSFSKLFKTKIKLSPKEFRHSFN